MSTSSLTPSRRSVIRAGAASVVAVGLGAGSLDPASAEAAGESMPHPYFRHGVASGDPEPSAVILWTRLTPTADSTPGSGNGPVVQVRWQVARDASFTQVVAAGHVETGPDRDHTVKVDATGLAPDRWYWFRFSYQGAHSPVGRTRTAPGRNDVPANVRLGVVSCSQWEMGYFGAYRHLAQRNDLNAIVHLGDYIYEYGRGTKSDRPFEPAHEVITVADYRQRHASYKTDPDLQALHARFPWIVTWDDHEVANNAWKDGAENHDASEGDYHQRRAAAYRAYDEWMPVRLEGTTEVGDGTTVFRRVTFGRLAEISMLDLHTYRDSESLPAVDASISDPARTIVGDAQMAWLKESLSRPQSQWKLIGNSMMITPITFADLPDPVVELVNSFARIAPDDGATISTGTWDGYTADRREVIDHIVANDITDTVFLTGDVHSAWATEIPVDKSSRSAGTAGVEFVCTSVTSDNLDDIVGTPPRTTTLAVEAALRLDNPHVKYLEMDSHGYSVFDVTPERAQMDYYVLADKHSPTTTARCAASYASWSGSGRVTRVSRPV